MTKQITITISDHVYDTYLSEITKNRSQYIEKLIMMGAESEIGQDSSVKSRMLKLLQESRNKEEEIKRLKAEIGRLKRQLGSDPDLEKKDAFAKGVRNSGILREFVG